MSSLHPRWEWRTFGTTFGNIDKALCQLTSASRRLRSTYIVSDASPGLIRIRDRAIEVKVPLEADAQGIELWAPAWQGSFPLDVEALEPIFASCNVPTPRCQRATYGRESFLRDIVLANEALNPIAVTDEAHTVFIDGCTVTVSDLWFDGYPLRTVGVVADDRAQVRRVIRGLQLSSHRPTNYVTALKQHIETRGCRMRRQHLPLTPNAA